LIIEDNAILREAVLENEAYIKTETLTNSLEFTKSISNGVEIEFDAIKSKLLISKNKKR
jgi:isoleucyl-tRNA synthetase